jgi:hypothetical protein
MEFITYQAGSAHGRMLLGDSGIIVERGRQGMKPRSVTVSCLDDTRVRRVLNSFTLF